MPSALGESDLLDLLAASRQGSSEALGKLLEEYRPYLLLIANEEVDSGLRGKAGASDLVQESFLEAQRDFDGFRGTRREELLAWLRQILLHNVSDFQRRFRDADARRVTREQNLDGAAGSVAGQDLVSPGESPSTVAMAHEQSLALARALERLSEDYRRALVLRHQDKCSFAEIGQALNRSEEAARKIWFRAVEQLRQELQG
jgi:RNA polymerase sigma-70 factor (ECF subfamily)